MKSLVIYDSYFGNTEKIALAVSEELGESKAVRIDDLKDADYADIDLLVLGSPTRGFKPTEKIGAFLKSVPQSSLVGKRVATFDTRIDVKKVNSKILNIFVKLFGYAAEPMGKSLSKSGGNLVVKAEGFFVEDKEGPLAEGEEQRAREWARELRTKNS